MSINASGLIGNGDLLADTRLNLGTLGSAMVISVVFCNRSTNPAKIRLAFSTSTTIPDLRDFVDYNVILQPGTTYERRCIACSAGENVWVNSDIDGVSARAHGVLLG